MIVGTGGRLGAANDGARVFLTGGYNSSTIAQKTAQIYVEDSISLPVR